MLFVCFLKYIFLIQYKREGTVQERSSRRNFTLQSNSTIRSAVCTMNPLHALGELSLKSEFPHERCMEKITGQGGSRKFFLIVIWMHRGREKIKNKTTFFHLNPANFLQNFFFFLIQKSLSLHHNMLKRYTYFHSSWTTMFLH